MYATRGSIPWPCGVPREIGRDAETKERPARWELVEATEIDGRKFGERALPRCARRICCPSAAAAPAYAGPERGRCMPGDMRGRAVLVDAISLQLPRVLSSKGRATSVSEPSGMLESGQFLRRTAARVSGDTGGCSGFTRTENGDAATRAASS